MLEALHRTLHSLSSMEFIERLKASVDIVRTVGEYVRLRKLGPRFVGLCPFHTEKTPSFGVTPAMGIYKCFGCGAGGDVIKFVQEIEALTFWEACTLLAETNGIPLPTRREREDPETDLRDAIFEMHRIAADTFREHLFGSEGADARAYLNKRGLNQSHAEEFGLGFASSSGQDLARRFKARFSPEQCEASGLVGKREDGSVYDRFRGRLIFPIHNESGKIIAFGGRALRTGDEPKYLNSPATKIYNKSAVLYNLHRAKEAVRKNDRTVLVEGYMDVIGVCNAGVRQVVASCGTALRPEQVRAIKRHSENIVVNFDSDNAGTSAAEKSVQMLIDEGMHVKVLELEGGLDPDEYIKANGPEKYAHRLDKAPGYFIWLADRARRTRDMSTADGRMAGYQEILLPAIKRISDGLARASAAREVADYLGIDPALVLGEFRRAPKPGRPPAKKTEPVLPHEQRILLRSLLMGDGVREMLLDALLSSESARQQSIWPIVQRIGELQREEGQVPLDKLQASLEPSQNKLLEYAIFSDTSDEIFTSAECEVWLNVLRDEDSRRSADLLRSQLKEAERSGNLDEAFRIMNDLDSLKKARRR